MRSRTVSFPRSPSTSGSNAGSKAISEQVVRPARLSRAHSATQHRRVVVGFDGAGQQREHRAGFLRGAVEFAVGVAAEPGALGIWGVAGQAGVAGGVRIEEGLVSGVVDDHQRTVGRDVVEPGQRRLREPGLQQRIPAVQVGAGRSPRGDLAAHRRDDVVGVGQGDRPDVDDPVRQRQCLHQRMAMRLNESRHDAAVTEINRLGVGADVCLDVGRGSRRRRCGRRRRRAPRRWAAFRRR